jgi:predicted RNA-binding Zn-ribbon protein involved in translation (DUF1610 family)
VNVTTPDLPTELDGHQVAWQPWERSPEPSHIPLDCAACDYDHAPSMTFGKVGKRLAFTAFRCPRCRETRIYRVGFFESTVFYEPPMHPEWAPEQ